MSEIQPSDRFYDRIRDILDNTRINVARTVNTAQVLSNWLIGRAIIEEEQQGQHRAEYGESLLKKLAKQLKQDFGTGYSYPNLKLMRQFYLSFSHLLAEQEIGYALRSLSVSSAKSPNLSDPQPSWQTGQLHPNLSWTHYRTLMRVEKLEARAFYSLPSIELDISKSKKQRS